MGITDRGSAEANNRSWIRLRLVRLTELRRLQRPIRLRRLRRPMRLLALHRLRLLSRRLRLWQWTRRLRDGARHVLDGPVRWRGEGAVVRAMFARFRMGRWFTGERGRGPRVVALRRASQVFFLLLFLFLLLRTEFRGTVGAGGDVRLHWPVRLFFEIDPLAALCECAGNPCALSRAAVELDHSAAGDVSGAVLLRMDLPDGNAAPLLRQSAGRRANAASKASRRTATSSGRGRSTSY